MLYKLREVLNIHICVLLVKLKVSGFVAAFLCLDVALMGRSNKGYLLNCLEYMIAGETRKNWKQPFVIWHGT